MLQEGRHLRPRRKTRCAHARLPRSFSSLLPYGATSSGLNPLSGERMRCVVISGRYFIISRTGRGGGRRSGSRGPAGGQAGCGRPGPPSSSLSLLLSHPYTPPLRHICTRPYQYQQSTPIHMSFSMSMCVEPCPCLGPGGNPTNNQPSNQQTTRPPTTATPTTAAGRAAAARSGDGGKSGGACVCSGL